MIAYLLAVVGFLFIGIETRGRTIEELDAALARPVPIKAAGGYRADRASVSLLARQKAAKASRCRHSLSIIAATMCSTLSKPTALKLEPMI